MVDKNETRSRRLIADIKLFVDKVDREVLSFPFYSSTTLVCIDLFVSVLRKKKFYMPGKHDTLFVVIVPPGVEGRYPFSNYPLNANDRNLALTTTLSAEGVSEDDSKEQFEFLLNFFADLLKKVSEKHRLHEDEVIDEAVAELKKCGTELEIETRAKASNKDFKVEVFYQIRDDEPYHADIWRDLEDYPPRIVVWLRVTDKHTGKLQKVHLLSLASRTYAKKLFEKVKIVEGYVHFERDTSSYGDAIFEDYKRVYPKPVNLNALFDRQ